ncbi:hypothetical protein HMPREF1013_00180 [Bacillus sp. 2_A_57_CT2]|nr:hypothetical protein HMPREF1013_00180 [Bacillus sp. 2_A_57_CT2]
MFLLDNVFIILLVTAAMFVIFTLLNIRTFSPDLITSAYLTTIFFDLFFKMPFKAVNTVFSERDKLLRELEKDEKLTEEQKEKIRYIFEKRSRIFLTLYKAGEFSYTELMINLTEWYKNKPFRVRISVAKQKRKSYETKYLSDVKKDLVCLGT